MNAQRHLVRRTVPWLLVATRDPVTDDVGQMQLRRSAAADVDHLHAAADSDSSKTSSWLVLRRLPLWDWHRPLPAAHLRGAHRDQGQRTGYAAAPSLRLL